MDRVATARGSYLLLGVALGAVVTVIIARGLQWLRSR